MKKGKRLYINITNRCNTNCPFCCMYSGTNNNKDMNFEIYKKIIDDCTTDFELQLEGGEPLLHPNLYLFMEYAISKVSCKKIIILTNGILLEDELRRLADFSTYHHIEVELKISINYWLIQEYQDHTDRIKRYIFDIKYIPTMKITCNVRLRKEDGLLRKKIEEDRLLNEHSNIFYLQSYGRLNASEKYEKPVIVQNIEEWSVYAVDGTDFKTDLIGRSEYEHMLQMEAENEHD
jgi:organic radical activating enzyme